MKVKLDIYDDLGGQRQIGFVRPDLEPAKVVHTIVRAAGGEAFTVDEHFATCELCDPICGFAHCVKVKP